MRWTAAFVMALSLGPVACDGAFGVRGQVIMANGTPLSGVEISGSEGAGRELTDERGCFDLFSMCSVFSHQTSLQIKVPGRSIALGKLRAPSQHIVSIVVTGNGPDATVSMIPTKELEICGIRSAAK